MHETWSTLWTTATVHAPGSTTRCRYLAGDLSARLASLSRDDAPSTAEFVSRHRLPFAVGHSADVDEVVKATGAYETTHPVRGRFLENTGFVLAPDGTVVNAVYSSRAIGRLVPGDVIRLVAFMESQKASAPAPG